jgi:hypothetical protein
MENKIEIKIIKQIYEGFENKILIINFKLNSDLKKVFTPKLENIGFSKYENQLSIRLKKIEYREHFNEWIEVVFEKMKSCENKNIEFLNREIKTIISFGKKEKEITWQMARGLYGELYILDKLLEQKEDTEINIIESWHRPSPAVHDFDFENHTIEVKTISRESTTIKINSIYQLESQENKTLFLNCLRIEKIEKSNIDSLGLIYNKIINKLDVNIRNIFEEKCFEDAFFRYLGPEFMPLEFKFIVIDESLYEVNQSTFPRINKYEINSAISNVSYSIDISSIENYKINGNRIRNN